MNVCVCARERRYEREQTGLRDRKRGGGGGEKETRETIYGKR